jgi:predicted helicase
MTTFSDILSELRELAGDNKRYKGDLFENLIVHFLQTEPMYADLFSDVWKWADFAPAKSMAGRGQDVGIDLVARERNTGEYCAIQCKFYSEETKVTKEDVDSFLSASSQSFATLEGKKKFSHRLLVTTTRKLSRNVETIIENQNPPCTTLDFFSLENSKIDWSQFSLKSRAKLKLKPKHELREHQKEAVEAVAEAFLKNGEERGKLIMACGTGKTFTALRAMERVTPKNGRILFLAPSISLVSQSLREWTAEAKEPFTALAVCSDSKVGKENEDIRIEELAYPATTDTKKLLEVSKTFPTDRRVVVFSTYQSIDKMIEAQRRGFGEFDLVICDEAHRTTGVEDQKKGDSEFQKIHSNANIQAKKRLYMTATPRIYMDKSKSRAKEVDLSLYSMDDETIYGRELYKLNFGKAVEKGLLTEYKVLIVAVDDGEISTLVNNYNKDFSLDDKTAIDGAFATKIVGAWKGISKEGLVVIDDATGERELLQEDTQPMRRAVAFSSSIKNSQAVQKAFTKIVNKYREEEKKRREDAEANGAVDDEGKHMVDCLIDHVDGSMNSGVRLQKLGWLKEGDKDGECRILSNARCLTEGVDVPTLDAVIFLDTRNSIVDIVQAVGRVMRLAEGKRYGYIILPVCIPSSVLQNYNEIIEHDEQFKGIWKVIKALRAHDERLVDEIEFRKKISVIGRPKRGRLTNSNREGKGDGQSTEDGQGGEQINIDLGGLPLNEINEAVYAAIPRKLGDIEYWSEWAKDVGVTAQKIIARIQSLIEHDEQTAKRFKTFLKGLQDTLNPSISEQDAIEMVAQHILTLPVFDALFPETEFTKTNPVAKALQKVVARLDTVAIRSETESLETFYQNVIERIHLAKDDKSKQGVIRNLYDTFFNNAFPRMAKRLGIVYTPVQVVDFILKSVQYALKKHFNADLGDQNIHILDPFSGTGTFLVRLIQSGLIALDKLPQKYAEEMHANEIVLLAYYIATVNIETAFHAATGKFEPFEGMVLTDTFQITEKGDLVDTVVLPENNDKITKQLALPIRVIVGNPPYSAQQNSENDNNQNMDYPTLDARIAKTYAAQSKAKNLKNLYDSYIRAIRWSSDRIGDKGVVAFVTNGSFLDANNMDGLRKCLAEEYSTLYVFNLRGNARTQGEQRRKEGGGIFDAGSRAPIAITVMVKDPKHQGKNVINYHDIGDYLKRDEKLKIIEDFGSIGGVENWQNIKPNAEEDWINQRDPAFENFISVGEKEKNSQTLFNIFSLGVITSRDFWVYNFSRDELDKNIGGMIETYNKEVDKYQNLIRGDSQRKHPEPKDIVIHDPKKISWSSSLLPNVERGRKTHFDVNADVISMYRPFQKMYLYFGELMIHRECRWRNIIPKPDIKNLSISLTGIGAAKSFSALVTNVIPNLHLHDTGQCFPLYWYEKSDGGGKKDQGEMFAGEAAQDGYIRHDAVTDWALKTFRKHYGDASIEKEDIFWYCYGILHSPEYKERFADNLKRMLPRIPLAKNFAAFCDAGKKLGTLHLNYETVEPYPLVENKARLVMEGEDYRVHKMRFDKTKENAKDKTAIVYNNLLTLSGIPPEAYEYVVNGQSAIEWIMERYAVTVDKASGIENDPNEWSDDPRYIVDLLKRIVTVSVESVKIIKALPPLEEFKGKIE